MTSGERRSSLELGLIGNCQISALVDAEGSIVWCCWPRFDSAPVFDALLDDASPHGRFAIELEGCARVEQHYVESTAVLVTRLIDGQGGGVEITDFVPRFELYGRMHRPTTIVRHVRPLAGGPRIRIRCRPRFAYGAATPTVTRGSHHLRFVGDVLSIRLTTDAPLGYIVDETLFKLDRPLVLYLGADETVTGDLVTTARDFQGWTVGYWRSLTGRLQVPAEWQSEVIRAAITLKLCSFEETGAIVAAHTTSLPEADGEGRNWDYRFCWLRDAFFVVRTLNRLGYVETMADHLVYLRNIAADSPDGFLQPVYGIGREAALLERQIDTLRGYRGNKPVRVGNQAYEHHQHDGYGSVILAVTQAFFDRRLREPAGAETFRELERLGEKAFEVHAVPDAGLWEFRGRAQVHTHSSMMCWAACDRLARIAIRLGLTERATFWAARATSVRETVLARAWSERRRSFTATFEGEHLDAALLLMPTVGFVDARDPRFLATLDAIGRELASGPFVYRYAAPDDFGAPANAFLICSFWYIEALTRVGRNEEARAMFERMLGCRNRLGLMAEHIDIATGELWGNVPQTYSHVGLIDCAMRLSRPWEDLV
jgi:GH15 family glucan-1,4-alpha-glucosidase